MHKFFEVLSDPSRYEILQTIADESEFCNLEEEDPYKGNCIKIMAEKLSIAPSTISHHIKILENNNFVYPEKKGKWTYYFPNWEVIFSEQQKFLESLKPSDNLKKIQTLAYIPADLTADQFQNLISLLENYDIENKHTIISDNLFASFITTQNKLYKIVQQNSDILLQSKSKDPYDKEILNLIQNYIKTL